MSEEKEEKLVAVPFLAHGEIKYHIDWSVQADPKNPDEPIIGFDMRYNVNPEVMMVISEIMRHQLEEVMEKDKKKPKKDRMTPLQLEMHKKTVLLCNSLVSQMGEVVYGHQLKARDYQSKVASGEIQPIEVVDDPKVLEHIKKHG